VPALRTGLVDFSLWTMATFLSPDRKTPTPHSAKTLLAPIMIHCEFFAASFTNAIEYHFHVGNFTKYNHTSQYFSF
jgi:hypothetical protein